jgi:outer membrane translocation and assembly module TamA
VTDLFAVLGLSRSPWLDAEELKQRHHALMAAEASANSSPAILNEARRTLQNPALRIRHFLALEFPDHQPTNQLHQDWDFFLKVGDATRQATELAARKSSLSHPLARAALQKEILNKRATLLTLKEEIEKRLAAADARLQAFEKNPEVLQALSEEFAFLQKNQTVVRETMLTFDQGLA